MKPFTGEGFMIGSETQGGRMVRLSVVGRQFSEGQPPLARSTAASSRAKSRHSSVDAGMSAQTEAGAHSINTFRLRAAARRVSRHDITNGLPLIVAEAR